MKSNFIGVRVTDKQKEIIQKAANAVNMTISEFIIFTATNQASKILEKKEVANVNRG